MIQDTSVRCISKRLQAKPHVEDRAYHGASKVLAGCLKLFCEENGMILISLENHFAVVGHVIFIETHLSRSTLKCMVLKQIF